MEGSGRVATTAREQLISDVQAGILPIASSPADLEVWLGPDMAAEPPLYGSNGDPLPTVASSFAKFEWYKRQIEEGDAPILQKQTVQSTIVSPITGCWLPTSARYRTHGGYVPSRDKTAAVSESGSSTRHRTNWQRVHVLNGEAEPLTPESTWEHYCRTPGCSEPEGHGEMMSIERNNERKNDVQTFENYLWANQPMWTVEGMSWLESLVNEADEGLVDAIVVTRHGAYILEVLNGALYGHHVHDPVRDAMRTPAPYPHRKEKLEVHEHQLSVDADEMYADLLRRAIARRKQHSPDRLAA